MTNVDEISNRMCGICCAMLQFIYKMNLNSAEVANQWHVPLMARDTNIGNVTDHKIHRHKKVCVRYYKTNLK